MSDSSTRTWFITKELLRNPEYGEYASSIVNKLTDGDTKNINEINQSEDYFGYFGLKELPLFNLLNPDVINWHSQNLKSLIKEYGFSDVRLDSGFIHPRRTIKQLTESIHDLKKDASVLVEYWPFYGLSSGECYGFCDGEFDVTGTIFLNEYDKNPKAIEYLKQHFFRIRGLDKANYKFITGLTNHDLPRFQGNPESQKLGAILNFTIPPFIPIMLYGEEIPLETINDRQDRIALSRDLMEFQSEPHLFAFYKKLIDFRKKYNEKTTLTNFQINDIHEGYHNQLVSYNVNILKPKKTNTYSVIINKEQRDKPVDLSFLLQEDVKPHDIITEKELQHVEDNKFLIKAKTGYILDNKKNDL